MAGSTAKLNPFSTISIPDTGVVASSDQGNNVIATMAASGTLDLPWNARKLVLPAQFTITSTNNITGFFLVGTVTAGNVTGSSGVVNGTPSANQIGIAINSSTGVITLTTHSTFTTAIVQVTKLA